VSAKARYLAISYRRGIKANPRKIQAIMDMAPPQSTKDIQRPIGRLAALNKSISRSVERSLPFLKMLHGAKNFTRGPEQAATFESLKQYMSNLLTLTSPDPVLPLILYIAASPSTVSVVSAALVQERSREGESHQCPVYFASEVLTTSKCNMIEFENIAYAVQDIISRHTKYKSLQIGVLESYSEIRRRPPE
jgi:hypothetical protein